MKYLLFILLSLPLFAAAQYVPNAGAYQWKGGKFTNSLQPPSATASPVTATNAPDSNYAALYYNKTDTTWYQFNPVSKLWSPFAGKIEIGTGDSIFISSIDSIFITNTDSIFIVSGNDTIYIGDGPGPYASLYSGFGINIFDSSYNPAGADAIIAVDTAGLASWVVNIVQGDTTIINNTDSIIAEFYVDTLANAPPASPVEGYKVLIGTSPTGDFAGHENEIAERVGSIWTFTAPEPNDVAIVDNIDTYATYQWNGTRWVLTTIVWRVGGNKGLGNNGFIGTKDKKPWYIKAWNKTVIKIDTTRHVYFPKWSGLENEPIFFKPGAGGMLDTGHFRLPVYDSPAIPDSIAYIEDGQIKYGLHEGGGGSQTLQQAFDNDPTADPDINAGANSLDFVSAESIGLTRYGSTNGFITLGEGGNILSNQNDSSVNNLFQYIGDSASTAIHLESQTITTTDGNENLYVSSLNISPSIITIDGTKSVNEGSAEPNLNLQILNLDSSDADQNNIMWMDENSIVHRGYLPTSGGGTTTNPLTVGTGLQFTSGSDFDGSAAREITIDNTVATLTGTQTLTNKTLTSPIINVGSDATGDIYYRNSGGSFTRLPIGTTGQPLVVSGSSIPQWGGYIAQDSIVIARNGIGSTNTARSGVGLVLENNTAATVSQMQYSPVQILKGNGWNTSDATSRPLEFRWFVIPSSAAIGAGNNWANGILYLQSNAGGTATTVLTIAQNGNVAANRFTATDGVSSNWVIGSSVIGGTQIYAGGQATSQDFYRTTNAGSDIAPFLITGTGNTTGHTALIWDRTNGLGFTAKNDNATRRNILSANIYLTDIVSTAGSESASLSFATKPTGSATTEKMRLTSTGNLLINTTTDVPSAKVTIASTTQGFLPPRMTAAQAGAISSPAEGLLVYVTDTDGTFTAKGWWGWEGSNWVKLNN